MQVLIYQLRTNFLNLIRQLMSAQGTDLFIVDYHLSFFKKPLANLGVKGPAMLTLNPYLNLIDNLRSEEGPCMDETAVVEPHGQLGVEDLSTRDTAVGLELSGAR